MRFVAVARSLPMIEMLDALMLLQEKIQSGASGAPLVVPPREVPKLAQLGVVSDQRVGVRLVASLVPAGSRE